MTSGQGKLVHTVIPEEDIKITWEGIKSTTIFYADYAFFFFHKPRIIFQSDTEKPFQKKKKLIHEKEFLGFGRK